MSAILRKRLVKIGKEEKGFTLIELLAVIVIIGIIAVIAIPLISNVLNKSRSDADVATARQIYDAARLYITSEKNGDFVNTPDVTIENLKTTGYLDNNIYLPSTKKEITGGTVNFISGKLNNIVLNVADSTPNTVTYQATEILSAKANGSE